MSMVVEKGTGSNQRGEREARTCTGREMPMVRLADGAIGAREWVVLVAPARRVGVAPALVAWVLLRVSASRRNKLKKSHGEQREKRNSS